MSEYSVLSIKTFLIIRPFNRASRNKLGPDLINRDKMSGHAGGGGDVVVGVTRPTRRPTRWTRSLGIVGTSALIITIKTMALNLGQTLRCWQ